ncbi:hypothetical protein J4475_02160 [Candidatus Woesearchaeota archaeon]|nr:hypothetical protein [Candidatus Woesearchaeota archaeon]
MSLSRKGVELSTNFLVVLIIALVAFGLGLSLVFKIFSSAENILNQDNGQERLAIERELNRGEVKVSAPFGRATASPGESYVFNVGIRNDADGERTFSVEAAQKNLGAQDSLTAPISAPLKISGHEIQIAKVIIKAEKQGGGAPAPDTYVIDVNVYGDSGQQQYGSVQKLYLTVR